MTQEKDAVFQYCEEKHRDELTGCFDYLGFKIHAEEVIADHPEIQFAIWYCDIRQFKYINNSFGYETGDILLREVCTMLQQQYLKENELVGRIYGDHIALLTISKSEEAYKHCFARMMEKINAKMSPLINGTQVEMSSGIYVIREQDKSDINVSRFIDYANVAQKDARKKSGSSFTFFSEDAWQKETRSVEISRELHKAIKNGEIMAYIQPQFDYASDKMIGAEVLCRWKHHELGWISPGEFIPILEDTGQISELDAFIWEESCKYMQDWMKKGYRVPLSINISRKDILNAGLEEQLIALVEKYKIERDMLRLEITESAYIDQAEHLHDVVDHLRELGFFVEMDDFGSGFSSLNMLKNIPVSVLKLDLRFLTGDENGDKGMNVISAIVKMAHGMDMAVIAEGVETLEQAQFLKKLDCSLMQGYYFAHPMSKEEFENAYLTNEMGTIPQKFKDNNEDAIKGLLSPDSDCSFVFNGSLGTASIVEYDGSRLHVLMMNNRFYEIIGGSDIIRNHFGENLLEVFPAERASIVKEVLDRAVREEYLTIEYDIGREIRNKVRFTYKVLNHAGKNHLLLCVVEKI